MFFFNFHYLSNMKVHKEEAEGSENFQILA